MPEFNRNHASPEPQKLARARSFFERALKDSGRVDARRLLRYFELRILWDGSKSGTLTRADLDFLREGLEHYHGEPSESTWQNGPPWPFE
ncbi:MAG: hypothetical protein ACRD3D_05190 [Terriglobia bacterium]